MPSFLHEALLDILREHPEILSELFRRLGVTAIPEHDSIKVDSTSLGEVIPRELAADCLLRFEQAGHTELVVVLEVQLAVDPAKRFSWPAYLAGARHRHRCEGLLVVVSPDRVVADWARRPVVFGPGAGQLTPFVIGPTEIPAITDIREAILAPELSVLSAIAHGRDSDVEKASNIAATAFSAVFSLTDDRAQLYYDYVHAALGEAARKVLEMRPQNYEYQHEGLRRAKIEGKAEGKAEGFALALIAVLEARALPISDAQRLHILACTDARQLGSWISSAATATSTAGVIGIG